MKNYSVVEFCAYPPGNPKSKRCTDQYQKFFSSQYSVNLAIELDEDFAAEIEVTMESSTCPRFSRKTRIQYANSQVEPEISIFPIDNEQALVLTSTSGPAEIIVKQDQETLANIENGNIAITVANRSDGNVWAQAHSLKCNRYSIWETVVQPEAESGWVRMQYDSEHGDVLWGMGLERNTKEYIQSRITPEPQESNPETLLLYPNTQYVLEYSSGDRDYNVPFNTNPVFPGAPRVFHNGFEADCSLAININYVRGCKAGLSEDDLSNSFRIPIQEYGPNKIVTPTLKCGDNIFKWEYPMPPKYSYDRDQMEVEVKTIPSKCVAQFRVKNVEYNPWERLTVRNSIVGTGLNGNLEAELI
eukprot:gb/GECH01001165.1/.p1 GENE.gb/GECH01001165.1/~~gb/GECH01001165.1/.p1  ORF type:complete len:358 (+),score=36.20 gb/GECH01001165.1/:1-1074(+)